MSEWDNLSADEVSMMYDDRNLEECSMCFKHLPEEKRKMWNTYDDGYEIIYFCSVGCMINYVKPKLIMVDNLDTSSDD